MLPSLRFTIIPLIFFSFFLQNLHQPCQTERHSTLPGLLSLQPLQTGNSAVSLSSVNNCGIPVLALFPLENGNEEKCSKAVVAVDILF